jgi:hypothetical protein
MSAPRSPHLGVEYVAVVIGVGVGECGIPGTLPINHQPFTLEQTNVIAAHLSVPMLGELSLGVEPAHEGFFKAPDVLNPHLVDVGQYGSFVGTTRLGELTPGDVVAVGKCPGTVFVNEVLNVAERVTLLIHQFGDVALEVGTERGEPLAHGHGAEQMRSGGGHGVGLGFVHESTIGHVG